MNGLLNPARSPWVSLMILLALTMGYTLLYGVVAKLFLPGGGLNPMQSARSVLYPALALGTIFTFLLPSLTLQVVEPQERYFPQKGYSGKAVYAIVLLLLIVFSPIMQLVNEWNGNLTLPEALKPLEAWMRQQEDSMAELTARVAMVDEVPLLVANMVVLALLPAIAEEFFFRGNLMHIIARIVRNPHLAIWITAIIFSAIHFQFYGFLPRMLLGAFFGYMLVWTQNIWVPVVAHFFNNVAVTIMAFDAARHGESFEDLQSYESYSIFVYLGALVVSVLVGYGLYRYVDHRKKVYGARMD